MERLGKNWNGGIFVGTSSTIPNTNGMRNDVIDAFKEAGVGMIEWPGGCAASSYNWSAEQEPEQRRRHRSLHAALRAARHPADHRRSGNAPRPPRTTSPGSSTSTTTPATRTGRSITSRSATRSGAAAATRTRPTYEANYVANYDMLSTPVNGKKLNIVAGTDLIGKWPWLDTMLKNHRPARSTGSSSTTTSITPTTSRTSASPTRSTTTSSTPPTRARSARASIRPSRTSTSTTPPSASRSTRTSGATGCRTSRPATIGCSRAR